MQAITTIPKVILDKQESHLVKFYIRSKNWACIRSLTNTYTKKFKKKYHPEVKVILTALAVAVKANAKGVKVPLGNDHWSSGTNKAIIGQKLNIERFKAVVKDFEKAGLLKSYLGCKAGEHPEYEEHGLLSRVIFSDFMLTQLDKVKVDKQVTLYEKELFKYIVVKDSKKKGKFLNTQHVKGTGKESEPYALIKDWNNSLEEGRVSYDSMLIVPPIYQKQYLDNIYNEGRNYAVGGGIQTRSKAEYPRYKFKYDGDCPTVGLDFKNLQPRMLYQIYYKGVLPSEFDCYEFCPEHEHASIFRDLAKPSFLALMYSESEQAAKSSIFKKLRDDLLVWPQASKGDPYFNMVKPDCPKELEELSVKVTAHRIACKRLKEGLHVVLKPSKFKCLSNGDVTKLNDLSKFVVDNLVKHNHLIAEHLYQPDLWKELQNLESRIMDKVIRYILDINEVILTWHDGCRIKWKYHRQTRVVMEEAYNQVMDCHDNSFVVVEYEYKRDSYAYFTKKAGKVSYCEYSLGDHTDSLESDKTYNVTYENDLPYIDGQPPF